MFISSSDLSNLSTCMLKPEMKPFCLCDEVVQLFMKLHDSAALDPANWVLYLHVKV